MPKKPTLAAENVFCVARKEAAKFNDRLNSREGAAEVTGLDRTRLARIELDTITPYPEEVIILADAYNAPELRNYYCTHQCPLGMRTVPPLEMLQLDRLTITILGALGTADDIKKTILSIVEDGRITEDEKPDMDRVVAELDRISKATGELKLWIEKNLN